MVKEFLQSRTLDFVWLKFSRNLSISHSVIQKEISKKNAITKMREIHYKVIQVDMNLLDECMLNKCKINAWVYGIQKWQLLDYEVISQSGSNWLT